VLWCCWIVCRIKVGLGVVGWRCVCMCVCEREREGKRGKKGERATETDREKRGTSLRTVYSRPFLLVPSTIYHLIVATAGRRRGRGRGRGQGVTSIIRPRAAVQEAMLLSHILLPRTGPRGRRLGVVGSVLRAPGGQEDERCMLHAAMLPCSHAAPPTSGRLAVAWTDSCCAAASHAGAWIGTCSVPTPRPA